MNAAYISVVASMICRIFEHWHCCVFRFSVDSGYGALCYDNTYLPKNMTLLMYTYLTIVYKQVQMHTYLSMWKVLRHALGLKCNVLLRMHAMQFFSSISVRSE